MRFIIVAVTTLILGGYGVFLRDQLTAGHWWVLPICLGLTFAAVYWMSPEDRPTFHKGFVAIGRMFGLK